MDEENLPFITSQNGQDVIRNEFFKEELRPPRAIDEHIRQVGASVILLARATDGVGADTLTSLLRMVLESACCDVAIIDFMNGLERGPGCSIPISSNCVIVNGDMTKDLAPQIRDYIVRFKDRTVIINPPSTTLSDFWAIEPDIEEVMKTEGKSYYVFWIDHESDIYRDTLINYVVKGTGRVVVLACEPESPHEQAKINVEMPDGITKFVTIPRLRERLSNNYYYHRECLELAYDDTSVCQKVIFSRSYVKFLTDLAEVLK